MRTKGEILVQCSSHSYFSAYYSLIRKNGTRTSGGPCGIGVSSAGMDFVNGLRYKVTIELVGADPDERPKLEHYIPNWAIGRLRTALAYFKSKREQAKFPKARQHMRSIIRAHKTAKEDYKAAMKAWRFALGLQKSNPIPEKDGTRFP